MFLFVVVVVFFFSKLAMFFNADFNVMFQELHISKKVATHTQPKQQIYFTEAGITIVSYASRLVWVEWC